MHQAEINKHTLSHNYFEGHAGLAERRMRWVLLLTLTFMVVEIAAGYIFQSMALLADGWHMASHGIAFSVSLFGYAVARKFADDAKYSFGTWKISVLAGFTSAMLLGLIGLEVLAESVWRIYQPKQIHFNEAIAVAILGLCVNILSAILLHQKNHANHLHDDCDHRHDHDHVDLNHRAAYLHVVADAATSVLAIAALGFGAWLGMGFLDSLAGAVGAVIILSWSWQLIVQTSAILLDQNIGDGRLNKIKQSIESDADNRISDMHVWKIGPHHYAAILAIVTHNPKPTGHYKNLLSGFPELAHISIEINTCSDQKCV